MRFRRLKLSGFKSFVEPAELRIEPGLTGVVGPNGCGKSNLLEAIRWVMGESSARSLRGGGMDDVIFAGTTRRPPRDFAEVALLTEDADGAEIEVIRRIERGAGSAYRINGRDARARDVSLIFADAATGAHSPALVSQGRIAAVIAAKPAERRLMLEDAAGISGLHARRKDAESRLRATEANLERLHDALAALQTQIAALSRQARAAERYRALSDAIRLAEARLIFARWRDAAAAAAEARQRADAAAGTVATAQADLTRVQRAQAAAAARLATMRGAVDDRRLDAGAQAQRLATLSGQLEAAEQRLADLDREAARLDADRVLAERVASDAAQALARLGETSGRDVAALADDEAHRTRLTVERDEAERAERAAEVALARATAAQAGDEADLRIAAAQVAAIRARRDGLARDMTQSRDRLAALLAEPDPVAAAAQAARARTDAGERLGLAQAALAQAQQDKAALQGQADTAAANVAAARAALATTTGEHGALLRDREERLRRTTKQGGHTGQGGHTAQGGPAAIEALRVAPGYERALAAVLGGDARAMLGAPTGDGRFWTGAPAPSAVDDSLLRHVVACRAPLRARLALVHVADADDDRPLPPGHWLVTRAGRLRRWDGFVAQGEGVADAAMLAVANRLAELEERLPGERQAAAALGGEHDRLVAAFTAARQGAVAAERAVATAIDEERAALRALDRAEDARDRHHARRVEIEAVGARLADQAMAIAAELETAERTHDALPDPAAGRANLIAAQRVHGDARLALQSAFAALSAHDQAIARQRERVAAERSEIKGWQARAGDATHRLEAAARRRDEIAAERAVTAARAPALRRDIADGEAVRERLAGELAEAGRSLAAAEAEAHAGDLAAAAAAEALATAREARAGCAARAEAEEERRAALARVAGERFQCPPPLLPAQLGFATEAVGDETGQAAILERLTADRERIGSVNLVATSELAEAEQASAQSSAEQDELTEAVNRLRGSIGSLNREGRERLRAAFTQVDAHFRDLFTRLFQGGQAQLALVDADDPLEAGLEIYAQPPGKRLQSLSLLSGGEQALTAVALIFALFLTSPAPICVLDEVDAPLDDANVDRFCDLLDAMIARTDTRYLIVTHNAVTMSRMHRLFGVTMIERGVSRLVSVDLGGAERLLAAE